MTKKIIYDPNIVHIYRIKKCKYSLRQWAPFVWHETDVTVQQENQEAVTCMDLLASEIKRETSHMNV